MVEHPSQDMDPQGDTLGDVCVLGAGATGIAVARYLAACDNARVSSVTLVGGKKSRTSDDTEQLEDLGVRVVLGSEQMDDEYDLAVVSPGIPESSAFFRGAQAHAREVIGEPEFAWRESPWRWLAITGTNGKTTTTKLTQQLLVAGGLNAKAVGNIGLVATGEVLGRPKDEWFVTELSSFQLATSHRLHPRVACLLNVTPDHVEWHGSLEAYAEAKERVFANLDEGDLAVVSCEDKWCRKIIERLDERGLRICRVAVHSDPQTACAAFVRDDRLVVRLDGEEHVLVSVDSLSIKGEHNVQNALAAAACALEVGVPNGAVSHSLMVFRPLEHRIEDVDTIGGVRYVNDSKATNVDATIKALTAFTPGKVVVLLGGHDKGTDLDHLSRAVSARCKAAVCYGEAAERIAQSLEKIDAQMGLDVRRVATMREATSLARELADSGDVVLLSPACSSFDEFSSYRERGAVFKKLVGTLAQADGGQS